MSLLAEVTDNDDEKKFGRLKLKFDQPINDIYPSENWFKFRTGYSGNNGVGLYLLPEIGEKVMVFFPDRDEKNCFAGGVLRKDDKEVSEYKPSVKRFRTPHGKEIRIDENGILISALDDQFFIELLEKENGQLRVVTGKDKTELVLDSNQIYLKQNETEITLKQNEITLNNKSSKIILGEDISFSTKGDLNFEVEKDFNLKSRNIKINTGNTELNNNKTEIVSSGDVAIKGSNININGSSINLN